MQIKKLNAVKTLDVTNATLVNQQVDHEEEGLMLSSARQRKRKRKTLEEKNAEK